MSLYIDQFRTAAIRSTNLYGAELNPELLFDTKSHPHDWSVMDSVVADFKDGVVKSASALPGNCFAIVREASYVLFELGIDNVVTVGTVRANGRLHFTTTRQSIEEEMRTGFIPTVPANAHAWLTLDTGQVLDPTILPSWAWHDERREIDLERAIYLSGLPCEVDLVHEPFLTGFAYHLKVVSHPLAVESFKRYLDWLRDSSIFKRIIAKQRDA